MAINKNPHLLAATFIVALITASWPASVSANPSRPFTVADAIRAARVVNIVEDQPNAPGDTATFSPDGLRFLIHTRRGDIQRNETVDEIWVFSSREVEASLSSTRMLSALKPRRLVSVPSRGDWGAMDHIQWLGRGDIGFTAEAHDGRIQAFSADLSSGTIRQLTHAKGNVSSFAVHDREVLYFEHLPEAQPTVEPLDNRGIGELLWSRLYPTASPVVLKLERANHASAVLFPQMRQGPNDQIWMSPSGRLAVILAPITRSPGYWSSYRVFPNWSFDRAGSAMSPTAPAAVARTRYMLIDLEHGSARPLLDAPAAGIAGDVTPVRVFWSSNEKSVVVSNTFLPLPQNGRTSKGDGRLPATAEIDLSTGRVQPIFSEPTYWDFQLNPDKSFQLIVGLQNEPASDCLVVSRKTTSTDISTQRYCRVDGAWVPASMNSPIAERSFDVQRLETLNARPRVFAIGGKCKCRREIFDPAPQLQVMKFGEIHPISWKDANGLSWSGAIVYPTDYHPGQHYPLIVQTHGFRADQFLLMGPGDNAGIGTAYAAQPLANDGFLILQVGDNVQAITTDEREGPLVADGWYAGIQNVIKMGLADPTRIGLIAFSRSGFHLSYFLAKYPHVLAAANISDSIQPGYFLHALSVNARRNGAPMDDGPGPQAMGVTKFFKTNPLYKLVQSSTAIRLECIGPGSVVGMFETYSLLRDAGKPVDLIYFPDGSHSLQDPRERLGSQQGNVDWMRFWLQGYKDFDSAKRGQYARWEKLCDQQRSENSGQTVSCVPSDSRLSSAGLH